MIESVLIGVIAAVIIAFYRIFSGGVLLAESWLPLAVLGTGFLAAGFRKLILKQKPATARFNGLVDLQLHIHSPYLPDSAARWGMQGLISFLLASLGVATGPEGAATEWLQSIRMKFRSRSSRWFEQRRRTDASSSLAASVSAAFGAPFAGILVPMELGMGGRTLSTVLSSLSAFIVGRYLLEGASSAPFDFNRNLAGFHLLDWRQWLVLLSISMGGGLLATFMIRFFRYSEEGLAQLSEATMGPRQTVETRKIQEARQILMGTVLLVLAAWVGRNGFAQSGRFLEEVFWLKHSLSEVALVLCVKLFVFSVVLAAFGTVGVFSPLFTVGSLMGFCICQGFFPEFTEFTTTAGMIGASALLGGVLGMPVSGTVLAYELTGNSSVLLPCLLGAMGAQQIRRFLSVPSLIDQHLAQRGGQLLAGRTKKILESIQVQEAMIKDFDFAFENESVSELHKKISRSGYPFLPVVNARREFLGILTVDIIQEGYKAQQAGGETSPLALLMEAKDLLYRSRSRFQARSVLVSDTLAGTAGVFSEAPCVPVLAEDGTLQGLLLDHHVRVAYDREALRRSVTETG